MADHQKRKTRVNSLLFLALVVIALIGTIWPSLKMAEKAKKRTTALHNCAALARSLVAFKSEYSHFPCEATRETINTEALEERHPMQDVSLVHLIPPGNDANAYLKQLVFAETIVDDDGVSFWAPDVKGNAMGDSRKGTNEVLPPGNNSFAYVMATNGQPLTDVASDTPLVLAPTLTGGSNPTFDPDPYSKKLVYGTVDGSGKIAPINKNGHAITKGSQPLFATGHGSLFGTQIPEIKLPTPYSYP